MGTGGLDIWVLAGTSRQEQNFLCAIFWILGDVCGKIDADNDADLCHGTGHNWMDAHDCQVWNEIYIAVQPTI